MKTAFTAKNVVAQRIVDVGKEVSSLPKGESVPGLLGLPSWAPRNALLAALGLGGRAAEVAPSLARGSGHARRALDDILSTPGPGGIVDSSKKFLELDGWRPGLPTVIAAGTIASLPFAADAAYLTGDTVAPLAQAQATGETLMTNPFSTFVEKRAAEKTAIGASATRAAGSALGVLDNLFTQMVKKPSATLPANVIPLSLGRAAGVGAAGLGLGVGMDMLQGSNSVGSGVEYGLAKKFVPLEDRIQATDTAASAFLSQSGKNMANLLDDALRGGVNAGAGAAIGSQRTFNQDMQFAAALRGDPLLREATPQDKKLLRGAFESMTRFAPDLATDEFAVRNFLRESMLASNGPDYATLGNMARVNESIAPTGVLPHKPSNPV